MKYDLTALETKNTSWSAMMNMMSLDFVTADGFSKRVEGEKKAAVSQYSSQSVDY